MNKPTPPKGNVESEHLGCAFIIVIVCIVCILLIVAL
jgi:hypothetical protein